MTHHVVVYLPTSVSHLEGRFSEAIKKAVKECVGVETQVRTSNIPSSVVDIKFFDFHLEADRLCFMFEDVGQDVRAIIDEIPDQNPEIKMILLDGSATGRA